MSQQRSGSLANRNFSGSSAAVTVSRFGLGDHEVGQPEAGAELVAVAQRLVEMLAGVDEHDRRRRVDLRDHVQQHDRIGAEARHQRDASGEQVLDRQPQQRTRLDLGEAVFEAAGGDRVAEQPDVMGAHQMSAPALRM